MTQDEPWRWWLGGGGRRHTLSLNLTTTCTVPWRCYHQFSSSVVLGVWWLSPKAMKLVGGRAWLWTHIQCLPPKLSPSALSPTTAREVWQHPHRPVTAGWNQECKRPNDPPPSPRYLRTSPGPSPNSTLMSWNHEAPEPYWKPQNSWCSRHQHTHCQPSPWFHDLGKSQTPLHVDLRMIGFGPLFSQVLFHFLPPFSPNTFPVLSGKLPLFTETDSILIFKRMLY